MARFQYKKVLLVGATSGIGAALADTLVENGVFVVAVGRRKERLEEFVKKSGQGKADYRIHDITDLEATPKFVSEVFKAHPDIDYVLLNSGIQRGFDFTKPESVDLSSFELELKTNYLAPVHLTKALLPYLTGRSEPTALSYTSSGLAMITLTSRPGYSATKAALHSFVLALRNQYKNSDPNFKLIENYPPAVQTELHDSKHQPDFKNGGQIGVPLADFNAELWEGLCSGEEHIPVGPMKSIFNAIEPPRFEQDKIFNDRMDVALKAFMA